MAKHGEVTQWLSPAGSREVKKKKGRASITNYENK